MAALSVVANRGDATYQWQISTDGGTAWNDIAGATQADYTTLPAMLADSGNRYRVVVSADGASVTSNAVLLTVNAATAAPVITAHPTTQIVAAPNAATFTAAASGVPTPTWQWQLSVDGGTTFADIADATSMSYTTPATVADDNGKRYRAVASNAAGTVSSNAAALSVLAATRLTITPRCRSPWPP